MNICRIFAVDYIRRNAKRYFDALYVNKITDYKAFLKNTQPLFSEKGKFANKTTLEDSEENILSDKTLVSEEFSKWNKNSKY